MTTTATDTRTDRDTVARLQQEWIFRWDRQPGQPTTSFEDTFADLYDWSGDDVLLQDEFDPEQRSFDSARAYGEAFWPGFLSMRSAEHAIEEAPRVIVHGTLAASRFVFLARLVTADGTVLTNRCTTSQIWRKDLEGRWRIVRDQTMVVAMSEPDPAAVLAALPHRPI